MMRIFVKDFGVNPAYLDTLDQSVLYYLARDGKHECADVVVEGRCAVNNKDKYGQTPIYYAARENRIEMVRKLIASGADINVVDHNAQTCLYYAAKHGHFEMCELLLSEGVNVNHQDNRKQTALHFAHRAKKQNVVDLLVKHGATPIQSKKNEKKKGQSQKKKPNNERRVPKKYILTILKNGSFQPLSADEFANFAADFPDVHKYIENPDLLEELPMPDVPETAPLFDSWEKAAKKMVNHLWKMDTAFVFHEPVNPQLLGIHDYFDIIKEPMDFGTIKRKLNENEYVNPAEFVHHMELVFSNCMRYNGATSAYGQLADKFSKEFKRQYETVCFDFYLRDEEAKE